jgi:hypothetical protein
MYSLVEVREQVIPAIPTKTRKEEQFPMVRRKMRESLLDRSTIAESLQCIGIDSNGLFLSTEIAVNGENGSH